LLRLLRFRDFRLLWFGGLITMIGDWALFFALPYEVYQRTGSPLATGAVFVAAIGPAIIFGSAAGVIVDRYDRRRLMIILNIAMAVALVPLFGVDTIGLWLIYAVLIVTIGIYRFARIWVSEEAAGYAALLAVGSSAIAETVHVFGQLPTMFSLGFLLNAIPE